MVEGIFSPAHARKGTKRVGKKLFSVRFCAKEQKRGVDDGGKRW